MKYQIIVIVSILLCLIVAKSIEKDLVDTRKSFYPEAKIGEREKVKPLEIIGTVLLGGFRVFIVDVLWMKVLDHQENGDRHEVLFTSEMISQLQPTYISVWTYLCWLMSVQIASEEKDIQTQIEWIKVGLSYIQKGIDRNPTEAKLYLEYARTVYERLALSHRRNVERYYIVRRSGEDPLVLAREYILKAIATETYTVYSERQLFLVNQARVKESFFHFRRVKEKKFQFYKLIFDKLLDPYSHTEEEIIKLGKKHEDYKKEFGKEGNWERINQDIEIDLKDIRDNIEKYPEQYDFVKTLETHEDGWKYHLSKSETIHRADRYLTERVTRSLKKHEIELCLLYIDRELKIIELLDIIDNSDLIPIIKKLYIKIDKLNVKIKEKKEENHE